MSELRKVVIDYTNWRGVRRRVVIHPIGISFHSNEYHKTPQWLLQATDVEKGEERFYAMSCIHSWTESSWEK